MRKISRNYILFLGIIAAIPSFSTDMYLAAIPKIANEWHEPIHIVNYSLVLWFAAFSISLLLVGTLSDKYGRKPILLFGLLLFIISSALCAFATSVNQLIIFRILQGISASCPSSMAMAICRDKFCGTRRKIALAYVAIVISVNPMLSPSIGSAIMHISSWREIFITQAVAGIIPLILSLRFTETNKSRTDGGIAELFSRYPHLFKNKAYIKAVFILTFTTGPFLGYVAFAPIVYITFFHISDFFFSILFALNALCSMIGAYLVTKLGSRFKDNHIITLCLLCGVLPGIALIFIGNISPYYFFGAYIFYTFFFGMSRPVTNSLILSLVKTDIGSASSLLICYQFIIGAIGMSYTTHDRQAPVIMFAIFVIVMTGASLLFWLKAQKSILQAQHS